MFFATLKTRYDINLVADRQHIELQSISSALAHIVNLARDLYRCIAKQCNCEAYGLDAADYKKKFKSSQEQTPCFSPLG